MLLVPCAAREVIYGKKKRVQKGFAPLPESEGVPQTYRGESEGVPHTLLPPSLRKGVRGMVHRLLKVCVFLGYHFAQGVS